MKDPAVLFYYKDFLISTDDWDADELGWYVRLLMNQADKGSLPDDLEALATLARVKFSDYQKFVHKWNHRLNHKFTPSSTTGRIHNQRMTEVLTQRKEGAHQRKIKSMRGVYAKKMRAVGLSDGDIWPFLNELIDDNFYELSKEERDHRFNHRLNHKYNHIEDGNGIANANGIVDANGVKEDRGYGGKKPLGVVPLKDADRYGEDIPDPYHALRSQEEKFKLTIESDKRFEELDPDMSHYLEKWSLTVEAELGSAWRERKWLSLASWAKRYLLSVWLDQSQRPSAKSNRKIQIPEEL